MCKYTTSHFTQKQAFETIVKNWDTWELKAFFLNIFFWIGLKQIHNTANTSSQFYIVVFWGDTVRPLVKRESRHPEKKPVLREQ